MVTTARGRTTAGLAIAAALVALVANGVAPRFNGDDVPVYHQIAHSTRYAVADVLVLIALALVTAAFAGLSAPGSARADGTRYYARLATVIGGAIALSQAAIALYSYRQQAKAFAGANSYNVVGAFWATNALDHLSSGLFAMGTVVLLGIAPVLIGTAQLRGREIGRLGVAGIVGGAMCVIVGFGELLTSDQSSFDIPFAVGSVIVTLWLLATGIGMWRRPQPTTIDVTEGETTTVGHATV